MIPLLTYASRRYIWKQIVRKRHCKPGTKTNLNIRTILLQGRRPLSVVKTDVMFAHSAHSAHLCRAQRAHSCRGQRALLPQKHVFCRAMLQRYWYKRYALTQDAAYEIHLHHCEIITTAIPVRTVAFGLRSIVCAMRTPELRTHGPCRHG